MCVARRNESSSNSYFSNDSRLDAIMGKARVKTEEEKSLTSPALGHKFFEMLLLDLVSFSALALLGMQKARGKPAVLSPFQDQVLFSSLLLIITLGREGCPITLLSMAHFS